MLLRPDLRAGHLGWPRRQEARLAVGFGVTADGPSGTRIMRGGPTIARPVAAKWQQHPDVVVHTNEKKATLFDKRPNCFTDAADGKEYSAGTAEMRITCPMPGHDLTPNNLSISGSSDANPAAIK